MHKKSTHLVGFLFIAALSLAIALFYEVAPKERTPDSLARISPAAGEQETPVSPLKIGGAYELINQDGRIVSDETFAGQYKLIYFGFTNCIDVCPAGLSKVAAALNMIGKQQDQIQPIFITVDPDRDTPEVMKEYVAQFHQRLVGLTGNKEQITHVQDLYKVYAAKEENPDFQDYMMAHSSFIYLMGQDDTMIGIFGSDDAPEEIANAIQKALGKS